MLVLQAALLGVVQGLTEFLPVSSSAHLILARAFFGWNTAQFGIAFDVACHVGTLAALIAWFRREVAALAGAVPRAFGPAPGEPGSLLRLLAAGTLPIVVIGGTLADVIESRLQQPAVIAVTLALGAAVFIVAERLGSRTRDERSLGLAEALGLGIVQSVALVPGVSRAGITIAAGLLLGLRRDAAARFSFLLGIPAILAAGAKAGVDLASQGGANAAPGLFAAGMLTSGAVGYLTVKYFLRYLAGHSLVPFAIYRLVLAGAVALWAVG